MLMTCLISFWVESTNSSTALAWSWRPSLLFWCMIEYILQYITWLILSYLYAIVRILERIWAAGVLQKMALAFLFGTTFFNSLYLLNLASKHTLNKGVTFCDLESLQIQMTGILLFLISWANSAAPPRSPADMPSTSSMINTTFLPLSNLGSAAFILWLDTTLLGISLQRHLPSFLLLHPWHWVGRIQSWYGYPSFQ